MKIVISGYGKMGHMIEEALRERNIPLALASEDIRSIDPALARECVCIDFTTPSAFRENYPFLASHFRAVVVGTTGWYDLMDEVRECFEREGTPLVWASNFSIGMNVFMDAVERMSALLGRAGGYSPYVVEKHHIHKLDAPSGTARTLALSITQGMGVEVPVSSVRVGEVPGIHTVGFEGTQERITLEHEAFSRRGFAEGAVTAALLTEGLSGVHEFRELL